jgi:starch synthase
MRHPAGIDGEQFATIERALDERTIGHNPERLNLMKVTAAVTIRSQYMKITQKQP